MSESFHSSAPTPEEPRKSNEVPFLEVAIMAKAILDELGQTQTPPNRPPFIEANWQDKETFTRYFLYKLMVPVPGITGNFLYQLQVEPFMKDPPAHGYMYNPVRPGQPIKCDAEGNRLPRSEQPPFEESLAAMIAHLQTAPVAAVKPAPEQPKPLDPAFVSMILHFTTSDPTISPHIELLHKTKNPTHQDLLRESIASRMQSIEPLLTSDVIEAFLAE